MKVAILTIGDELLIGQTIDTNASHIAKELNQIGVEIIGKQTVGDQANNIKESLTMLSSKADLIITTGGLGPTKDDITKEVISDYLGRPMIFNKEIFQLISDFFEQLGRKPTEAHRQQAYMPAGVELMHNKLGTAPGMWFTEEKNYFCHLPGVPYEMKILLHDHVIPKIRSIYDPIIVHRTLRTAGAGETQLADLIRDIENQLPEHLSIAYLPDLGTVRVRVTGRGASKDQVLNEVDQWFDKIKNILDHYVYGMEDESLSEALGNILRKKELKVGTAESCTGGYIAHQIVTPAGASDYYEGSIITYSYEAKTKQLKVKPEILLRYGAVSEETVRAMLEGLFDKMDIDVGLSVSGIAGPGGGTPDKPVGTIWIAYGSRNNIKTKKILASKERALNIKFTSNVAINLLRKFLLTDK